MPRRAPYIPVYRPSGAPQYFGLVNGLAMSVFGILIYYSRYSVTAFGLSIAAVVSLILAIVAEAAAKGWHKEVTNFVSAAFPAVAFGYLIAPYLRGLIELFVDAFVGVGKYIVSLIDPSRAMLLFPIVAVAVPLLVEGVAVFVRSAYFSAVLALLGYPALVFAVCLPLAVGLVAFVSYVYVSYFVYVISMAVAAGMLITIKLLDSLAVLIGMALLFGGGIGMVRIIPDIATGVTSAMVDFATVGMPDLEFREGVKRFYILSIFNYFVYFALGYSAYMGFEDWYALMSAAIALIATADLSLIAFYMLRQYPTVTPRLARRIVYLASGVEAMAMLILVMSGIGVNVVVTAFKDMISRLMPFYYTVFEVMLQWILSPL